MAFSAELIVMVEGFIALGFIGGLLRYFGMLGLCSYILVALIAANIQVLKAGQFLFPTYPVAMGTLLFATIALSFDILSEYYGKQKAVQGIYLSFAGLILFTLLIWLAIATPQVPAQALQHDNLYLHQNHRYLQALFQPFPGIIAASLIAYIVSQYTDVLIYLGIKKLTQTKLLGLRAMLSISLSALVDTCLFSVLAWKLFAAHPVSWFTLVHTYILGTYPLRLIAAVALSPFIYFARYCLPRNHVQHLS